MTTTEPVRGGHRASGKTGGTSGSFSDKTTAACDPQVSARFVSPAETADQLIPRHNDMTRDYYAATERKHFGDRSEPGSKFLDENITTLNLLVQLAAAQRGGLDGDDRDRFIELGATPDAFLPGNRYIKVETAGTVGVMRTDELDEDDVVSVVRTKPGAPCSVVADVTHQPDTDYGVLVITEDTRGVTEHGGEFLVTAFPGPPTNPTASDELDLLEGHQITVRQLREILGGDVWANTRIR